jgi:hypothetical protein
MPHILFLLVKHAVFYRVDPKELEGRVIEHGQTIVQLGNHYTFIFIIVCL